LGAKLEIITQHSKIKEPWEDRAEEIEGGGEAVACIAQIQPKNQRRWFCPIF
jgi:hypothetical protein